jgi:protein-disulfide isomerase
MKGNSGLYVLAASIILAAGLLGAALIFKSSPTGNQPVPSEPPAVNIKDVDTENEPFLGSIDAPLTLAYWSDYQCPFCKRFETQTLAALKQKYVDTGKLRIVFKDFQFLGPDSQTAGIIGRAVWEQVGQTSPIAWWDWQKAMFARQDAENAGWGSEKDILALTADIPGIDIEALKTALKQNRQDYQKEINEDRAEGARFGIGGTPGFILEDQQIIGARSIQVFEQVIENLLKQKSAN